MGIFAEKIRCLRGSGTKTFLKNSLSAGVIIVVTALISACQFGDRRIQFREEVRLVNGELISVDRVVKAKPLGEIGGPGGWEPIYMSLQIAEPKNPGSPPKWESEAGLVPILFDRDPLTNEWVLLATFFTCEPWYRLGRPKLPYAEFRVRDGHWRQVDLSTQWIGRSANIFTGIRSSGEPDMLTLSEKDRRDSDPAIAAKYRKIVGHWTTNC